MDKIFLKLLGSAYGRNIIVGMMLTLISGCVCLAIYVAKKDAEHGTKIENLNAKMLENERRWSDKFERELKQQIEISKEALRRQDEQMKQFRTIIKKRK